MKEPSNEEKAKAVLKMIKDKVLLKAVARRKYATDIQTVLVFDGDHPQFYLVYDIKRLEEIDWNFFEAKEWHFQKVENLINTTEMPALPVYITESFWTCRCTVGFLHHTVFPKCPICKTGVLDNTRKFATIGALTQWRL